MNKDTLMNSGGISYTNEEGKKMIAALLYKRNSERMSKAVDDALSKQAEELRAARFIVNFLKQKRIMPQSRLVHPFRLVLKSRSQDFIGLSWAQ
jgi:hypothetical protein